MSWDALVGGIVAILTFGLSLVWPADGPPAPPPIERAPMEAPRGTMHMTTFGKLPEEKARALSETLTKGIARCWEAPPTALGQDALILRIQVQLDGTGHVLSTKARVPDARADSLQAMVSVAAAERAVRSCQPYDLPEPSGDGQRTIGISIDFQPDGSQPPAK
jgi:hypothetical protein